MTATAILKMMETAMTTMQTSIQPPPKSATIKMTTATMRSITIRLMAASFMKTTMAMVMVTALFGLKPAQSLAVMSPTATTVTTWNTTQSPVALK